MELFSEDFQEQHFVTFGSSAGTSLRLESIPTVLLGRGPFLDRLSPADGPEEVPSGSCTGQVSLDAGDGLLVALEQVSLQSCRASSLDVDVVVIDEQAVGRAYFQAGTRDVEGPPHRGSSPARSTGTSGAQES
ncbi:hypothetical protein [Streptomyces sp. NPDC059271]|uniref:hypothetical protein n=1 Tax=Streptomyces sp. NPDC059271 TaxID=3346799 RepID=UPI0036A1816D